MQETGLNKGIPKNILKDGQFRQKVVIFKNRIKNSLLLRFRISVEFGLTTILFPSTH